MPVFFLYLYEIFAVVKTFSFWEFLVCFSLFFLRNMQTVFNTSTKIPGMRIIKDLNSTRQLGNISRVALRNAHMEHAKMFPTDPICAPPTKAIGYMYKFTKIPTKFECVLVWKEPWQASRTNTKVCFALVSGFCFFVIFGETFQTSKCPPVHFSWPDISRFRESLK